MELLHVLQVASKKKSSGESVAIRLQLKKWGSAGPLATLQYETRIHNCPSVGYTKSGAKSVPSVVDGGSLPIFNGSQKTGRSKKAGIRKGGGGVL